MADLTDGCLRRILKHWNEREGRSALGLVVSEFIRSGSIEGESKRNPSLVKIYPGEHPIALQIYGEDPEEMARAARIARGYGADLIDINMGCPASRITRHGAGAGLLRHPRLAASIVREVVAAVDCPVTVKMRLGWSNSDEATDIARLLEEAGTRLLTVHGRTRRAGYSDKVQADAIASVKDAVSIPVIANGDIQTAADALRLLRETGCDGLMVGRGALKNPFLFREIDGSPPLSSQERLTARLRLVRDYALAKCREHQGQALHRSRKMLGLALRQEEGTHPLLRMLNSFTTTAELVAYVETAISSEGAR